MRLARFNAFLISLLLSSSPVLAAAETGAKAGLPQFDPHWWPTQIFWLVVMFVFLYAFFSKKTLPEIGGVLENRQSKIQGDIGSAESLRAEAATVEESYEKLMADARAESTRLLTDAAAQTKADAERRLQTLRDKGTAEVEALSQRLDDVKKKAKQDMHTQIAEIASLAAEKIVGIKPDLNRAQTVVQALKGREAA